jgi:hypothetical protein
MVCLKSTTDDLDTTEICPFNCGCGIEDGSEDKYAVVNVNNLQNFTNGCNGEFISCDFCFNSFSSVYSLPLYPETKALCIEGGCQKRVVQDGGATAVIVSFVALAVVMMISVAIFAFKQSRRLKANEPVVNEPAVNLPE